MSTQFALDFSAPPLAQARAVGHEGARRAEKAASRDVPDFRTRAESLILEKLRRGPASGEDCTDFVRASGLQMADGRALGALYHSLRTRGLIAKVGDCKRRRGNGTAGGSIYALTDAGRLLRDEQGRFAPVNA